MVFSLLWLNALKMISTPTSNCIKSFDHYRGKFSSCNFDSCRCPEGLRCSHCSCITARSWTDSQTFNFESQPCLKNTEIHVCCWHKHVYSAESSSMTLETNDLSAASPLHPVDPCPGRHQCQDSGHQIHQVAGCVALVSARLPQLVQTCTSDHQRWVQLQSIGPEGWILKKLLRETRRSM